MFDLGGSNAERLEKLKWWLQDSEMAQLGIAELSYVMESTERLGLKNGRLELDVTLARGLSYYTGAIFEVIADQVEMGSICGGGRYDNLTGVFGMEGMSGVGISFGADRIYDVMQSLDLFDDRQEHPTQLMFTNYGDKEAMYCLKILKQIRAEGINAELYPDQAKLKKQLKYANDKGIPFVANVGSREMDNNHVNIKNMETGQQVILSPEEVADFLQGLFK